MSKIENNFKSISWIRKNLKIRLKILKKIIKIMNLTPIVEINKFGEQTEYYNLNKINEFINSHDINHIYSILQISKIIGVSCTSINSVIKYLNLNESEFLFDEELNQIKQFYIEHKNDYKNFFQFKTNFEKYGAICALSNKEVQKKAEETCLEKYGVKNYAESEEFKIKFKETSLEKYGTEFPMQNEEIKMKGRQTSLELYGVEYASQTKDFRNRVSNTNLEKYGVVCSLQNEESKNKTKETNLKKIEFAKSQNLCSVKDLANKFNKKTETINVDLKRLNIEIITLNNDYRLYIKESDVPILENYFSKTEMSGTSYSEKEIVDFIKSICDYEIIENSKKIISPKELDIYIPQKKLAIEFDGLHWHNENHIENNYHLNKTKACNEKGIDLIHVFEDDWLERKEIVKSMIASRLGIYQQKIFARKCIITNINKESAKEFFNKNHLQGFAYGDLYLALIYNNEIVQCICINKKGWHDGNVELTRMTTKLNTQVIGGFSKLMKHVSDYIDFTTITSYIYKAWFNGKGYKESGFTVIKENNPSYTYIVNKKRIHKSYFRKDKIKKYFKNGLLKYYNANETEHELMKNNQIYRIYDCGTIKVIYE